MGREKVCRGKVSSVSEEARVGLGRSWSTRETHEWIVQRVRAGQRRTLRLARQRATAAITSGGRGRAIRGTWKTSLKVEMEPAALPAHEALRGSVKHKER